MVYVEMKRKRKIVFPKKLELPNERVSICGACLLDIDTENSTVESFGSSQEFFIALLNGCCHAFHATCIQTWAKRDSFCPQCKERFSCIGFYTSKGQKVKTKRCALLFFGDTISEDEQEERSHGISTPSPPLRRRRRVTRSSASTTQISPERLAEHRLRLRIRQAAELERQERIQKQISASQAIQRIDQSIARLPYQPSIVSTIPTNTSSTQSEEKHSSSFQHDEPSHSCVVESSSHNNNFAKITSKTLQQQTRVVIPSMTLNRSGDKFPTSLFPQFCKYTPKYKKDFLLP